MVEEYLLIYMLKAHMLAFSCSHTSNIACRFCLCKTSSPAVDGIREWCKCHSNILGQSWVTSPALARAGTGTSRSNFLVKALFNTKLNSRMGTMSRSSLTLVAQESSGTGPRDMSAIQSPTQFVVIKKVPRFTPSQVPFATCLDVATYLGSTKFISCETWVASCCAPSIPHHQHQLWLSHHIRR